MQMFFGIKSTHYFTWGCHFCLIKIPIVYLRSKDVTVHVCKCFIRVVFYLQYVWYDSADSVSLFGIGQVCMLFLFSSKRLLCHVDQLIVVTHLRNIGAIQNCTFEFNKTYNFCLETCSAWTKSLHFTYTKIAVIGFAVANRLYGAIVLNIHDVS